MLQKSGAGLGGIKRNLLVFSLLILVLIILALGVRSGAINVFDDAITGAIRQNTSPQLTSLMKAVTFWGNSETFYVIVPVTAAIFYLLLRRLDGLVYILLSSAGGWFFLELLKLQFHRARPVDNPLIPASGFSCPSGHAMMSIAFYGAVAYLLYRNLTRAPLYRVLIAGGAALLVLFIGISRVYLGVHYPSDVLVGFAAGGAWLIICTLVIQLIKPSRTSRCGRKLQPQPRSTIGAVVFFPRPNILIAAWRIALAGMSSYSAVVL